MIPGFKGRTLHIFVNSGFPTGATLISASAAPPLRDGMKENDRADRLAWKKASLHKWLARRRVWSAEELETLPADTKPRAPHQEKGEARGSAGRSLMIFFIDFFKEREIKGTASIRTIQGRFRRQHWEKLLRDEARRHHRERNEMAWHHFGDSELWGCLFSFLFLFSELWGCLFFLFSFCSANYEVASFFLLFLLLIIAVVEAWKEKALYDLPWKDDTRTTSVRRILELF